MKDEIEDVQLKRRRSVDCKEELRTKLFWLGRDPGLSRKRIEAKEKSMPRKNWSMGFSTGPPCSGHLWSFYLFSQGNQYFW